MKFTIFIFLCFVSLNFFGQKDKPEFIKVSIEKAKNLRSVDELIPLSPSCNIKKFNFYTLNEGRLMSINDQIGDTTKYRNPKVTTSGNFTAVELIGCEWLGSVKRLKENSKFFIEDIVYNCKESNKKKYNFIIVK